MKIRIIGACAGIALTSQLFACGDGSGAAQSAADSVTKAAYNNDTNGVTANFDDNLKRQVTRASVGTLSDQLHRHGDYKGLTFVSSDPAKNEYTYRADFSTGSMNVTLRLDPDGKISAYRVFPLN